MLSRLLTRWSITLLTSGLLVSSVAGAHSLRVSRGAYRDNAGLTRQRSVAEGEWQAAGAQATTSFQPSFKLSVMRDEFLHADLAEDDYTREIYGEEAYQQNTVNFAANQIWQQRTETRALVGTSSDGKVRTQSYGIGASRWIYKENLRVALDVSRTMVQQPRFLTLDYDSEQVGTPSRSRATGTTLGLRQLASASTIIDYALTYIHDEFRPPTRIAALQLRQFILPLRGALHTSLTRSYNRGPIATTTSYGQVDAWTAEAAWLQHLWQGAQGRLSYRYYREDETTRAYQDLRVYGADMVACGLVHDLDRDVLSTPLSIETVASRYWTNTQLAATTVELGLKAKF